MWWWCHPAKYRTCTYLFYSIRLRSLMMMMMMIMMMMMMMMMSTRLGLIWHEFPNFYVKSRCSNYSNKSTENRIRSLMEYCYCMRGKIDGSIGGSMIETRL